MGDLQRSQQVQEDHEDPWDPVGEDENRTVRSFVFFVFGTSKQNSKRGFSSRVAPIKGNASIPLGRQWLGRRWIWSGQRIPFEERSSAKGEGEE